MFYEVYGWSTVVPEAVANGLSLDIDYEDRVTVVSARNSLLAYVARHPEHNIKVKACVRGLNLTATFSKVTEERHSNG